MRIVAGQARGVPLQSPPAAVRPTLDRVRESLFAILGPLDGLTVVDVFAGSGALGLEALSRGAGGVAWVEKNSRHARIIRANLERVSKSLATPARTQVVVGDVRSVPRCLAAWSPDIVLADPPYAGGLGETLLADDAFREWLGEGLLVLEQARRHDLVIPAAWDLRDRREYGDCALHFLRASQ